MTGTLMLMSRVARGNRSLLAHVPFQSCLAGGMVKISVGTYKWFSYVLVCTDMGQGLPITLKRLAS